MVMSAATGKKTIKDALAMVNEAHNLNELKKAVDEIDRMFLADQQEITMSGEDWVTLNTAISKSPSMKIIK